jgi:hypothetical protein
MPSRRAGCAERYEVSSTRFSCYLSGGRNLQVLAEYESVRQIRGEGHRRWFTDEYFDLIVWSDRPGSDRSHITGFQLCYDRNGYERALTWTRDRGFSHERIDSGENSPGSPKSTPILVADGNFHGASVRNRFRAASSGIDRNIADLVLEKLTEYPGSI